MNTTTLNSESFERLPLLTRGDSKEIRLLDEHTVAIRLLPTVYSYTHNRAATLPGTDALRLRACQAFCKVLRDVGIDHAYETIGPEFIIARRVTPPPIEVVVKARHVGTPKHRYRRMGDHPVRSSHPTCAGRHIQPGQRYPERWVRFDWRHPLRCPDTGERLCDEPLPEALADYWIDVSRARQTALQSFDALSAFLHTRDIELVDICFFITEDGLTHFGELSPDCARLRTLSGDAMDKDVFRFGGSSEQVIQKYTALITRLEA